VITNLIGWLATILILISFTIKKDMFLLRLINVMGTTLWLVYGIIKNDLPLIGVNSLVLLIHLYWFYKNRNI
jgi:uncharacterized protein with PQ loop repeat